MLALIKRSYLASVVGFIGKNFILTLLINFGFKR